MRSACWRQRLYRLISRNGLISRLIISLASRDDDSTRLSELDSKTLLGTLEAFLGENRYQASSDTLIGSMIGCDKT